MCWRRVYAVYSDSVKLLDRPILRKNEFLSLRKKHRPLYCKHRTVRSKRRWNHLVCTQCCSLRLQIRKEKNFEERKALEILLEEHYHNQVSQAPMCFILFHHSTNSQEIARDEYERAAFKSIHNINWDVSMNVDATGVDGSRFSPHYKEDFKSGKLLIAKR